MYERNELTNVLQKLKLTDNVAKAVTEQVSQFDNLHSYIVYNMKHNGALIGWKIVYNISQNNKFNTLDPIAAASFIIEHIEKSVTNHDKDVVCYKQPCADILIRQYSPLINKLAKEQQDKWQWLEYEDLVQMCILCICDLYYKGYYIHKSLLYRTFNNYVLMHIRKDRDRPTLVSLEQQFRKSDGDQDLVIADVIPDTEQLYKMEQDELDAVEQQILDEMKGIIIDLIGIRQYDQLVREYGNKSTTAWSRKLMLKIKAHLFNMGISKASFDKYYG